jgi:hypothetical protein
MHSTCCPSWPDAVTTGPRTARDPLPLTGKRPQPRNRNRSRLPGFRVPLPTRSPTARMPYRVPTGRGKLPSDAESGRSGADHTSRRNSPPGSPSVRRTSLTANAGCWHARPMGIHATLMLAPGCSPWQPSRSRRLPQMPSRTVAAGADMRRANTRRYAQGPAGFRSRLGPSRSGCSVRVQPRGRLSCPCSGEGSYETFLAALALSMTLGLGTARAAGLILPPGPGHLPRSG